MIWTYIKLDIQLFTFRFYFNVKWMYMAGVHLFFIFHSTLHSSQSSRFRFKSHPAATKPAICQKHKLIPANTQKTIKNLYVFTFEKWAENIVDHIVAFMHQVPVAFYRRKKCNVEKKKDLCWWTEIRSHKGIRCSAEAPLEGWELNMRRSHSAWHITLISSWTEASGPRQTHTAPVEEYRFEDHWMQIITWLFCGGRYKGHTIFHS